MKKIFLFILPLLLACNKDERDCSVLGNCEFSNLVTNVDWGKGFLKADAKDITKVTLYFAQDADVSKAIAECTVVNGLIMDSMTTMATVTGKEVREGNTMSVKAEFTIQSTTTAKDIEVEVSVQGFTTNETISVTHQNLIA